MERTGALIERLLQQYHDNTAADKMLVTVQLLAAELQQQAQAANGTHKGVSVVMPKYITQAITDEVLDAPKPPVQVAKPVTVEAPPPPPPPVEQPKPEQPPVVVVPQPVAEPEIIQPAAIAEPPRQEPPPMQKQPWQWGHAPEAPTLTQQYSQPKERGELNEIVGQKNESLNERLRAINVELGSILSSSPVKDLKKAIGINDRYVFINDLFKGDETMYERSIKTINNFTILPEAEYWIKRELKLKLAWNEESETVKHFDQLVKRRFS